MNVNAILTLTLKSVTVHPQVIRFRDSKSSGIFAVSNTTNAGCDDIGVSNPRARSMAPQRARSRRTPALVSSGTRPRLPLWTAPVSSSCLRCSGDRGMQTASAANPESALSFSARARREAVRMLRVKLRVSTHLYDEPSVVRR